MKLIKPSIKFLNMTRYPLTTIEEAGRTCYKSEAKIASGTSEKFVGKLLKNGHLAMIEHAWASYRVICDRGVTHEIVRHRLFSYAQESTRYCNYSDSITYIIPPWMKIPKGEYRKMEELVEHVNLMSPTALWLSHLMQCARIYTDLCQNSGWSPQQARGVLPNALKTEIVMTGNLREWLHFFKLRTAKTAHPQMQEVANMLLEDIRKRVSIIFDNLQLGD